MDNLKIRRNADGALERLYVIVGRRVFAGGSRDEWQMPVWAGSLRELHAMSGLVLPSWATEVEVHAPSGEIFPCAFKPGSATLWWSDQPLPMPTSVPSSGRPTSR